MNDSKSARLNIAIPHPVRHQLDQLAREKNLTTTALVVRILETAITRAMHGGHGQLTTVPTEETYAS